MNLIVFDPDAPERPVYGCEHGGGCHRFRTTGTRSTNVCASKLADELRGASALLVNPDDLPDDEADEAVVDVRDALDSKGQRRLAEALRAVLDREAETPDDRRKLWLR